MDIVAHTPHGDADVAIVEQRATTTLGDVIGAITGQAVPRVALVDGRTVDCTTRLDDAGVLIGSIVTTEPPVPATPSTAGMDLVQIAGHGAGRIVRLEPGRYRIGPGRRATADELELSTVGHAEFDLLVEPDDGSISTTIVPDRSPTALDGVALGSPTRWPDGPGGGTLTVGTRAFQLNGVAPDSEDESPRPPARDGTVAFSRSPHGRIVTPRLPAVDAVLDATLRSPALWGRRTDDTAAFSLTFGVQVDASGTSTTTIDLTDDRAVAIVGSERFRSALGRTLLIEAVTLHGPADVDVVILTSPGGLAAWDWAKWLPHLRLDGRPAIWSSEYEIARWAHGSGRRARGAVNPSHRTLAVIDDASLWNQPESPLRTILASLPDDLLLLVLCDDTRGAPAVCRSVVAETPTGLARTQSFDRGNDLDDVWVALTETAVATSVARSLAPLVDVELPAPHSETTDPATPVGLHDLIGVSGTSDVIDRWAAPVQRSTLVIGQRDEHPVEIDTDVDMTVVVGSSMSDVSDVAASWLLAQCAERSPDACWVTTLGPGDSGHAELLQQLPHATRRHDATTPIVADRLVARLRSLLGDGAGPERILLVAHESCIAPAVLDDDLLPALIDAARDIAGLGLLIATDRTDVDTTDADVVLRVEREHQPGGDGRRATIAVGNGAPGMEFTPIEPSATTSEQLDIRPAVVGRAFTPLERRLALERDRARSTPDAALVDMVALLRNAADLAPGRVDTERPDRVVVPPPLPMRLDLDELFAAWPGDGVPLGLADDPVTGRLQPVWWQPGTGATLLFGSRRSGVEQVLSTIILGLADRFAADDVCLVAVERSATRRRALSDLDAAIAVADGDRTEELAATLDEIDRRLAAPPAPSASAPGEGPRLVVMIGDLAQLRRQLADTELLSRLDMVLSAACTDDPRLDVVAYASELASVGSFADLAPRRLVGTCSDPNELATLGIERPAELEGVVGRCRSQPDGDLVQLAMPTAPLETQLARRSIEGPP